MNDITGWCEQSKHDGCGGVLLRETGYHWWCACICHPAMSEPESDGPHHRAWEVWRDAREANERM